MENIKRKLIIDCDPGIDDALAIALALQSPQLEVLGITTVAGNRELEKTTVNTLKVLEYFGRTEIPVYNGAAKPLVRELFKPPKGSSHGDDGLGNVDLPIPQVKVRDNAAGFIKDALDKHPGEVTILAIGPLTNIALLFKSGSGKLLKDLYLMNGAFWVKGNVTEYAEYNTFIDPEAAKIVYSSEISTKVVGLDVTNPVGITKEEFEKIRGINTKQAKLFVMMYQWALIRKERERYPLFWDPIALMWLLDKDLIKGKVGRVQVITEKERSGQTIFNEGEGKVEVGASINSERFLDHLYRFLKFGEVI